MVEEEGRGFLGYGIANMVNKLTRRFFGGLGTGKIIWSIGNNDIDDIIGGKKY